MGRLGGNCPSQLRECLHRSKPGYLAGFALPREANLAGHALELQTIPGHAPELQTM